MVNYYPQERGIKRIIGSGSALIKHKVFFKHIFYQILVDDGIFNINIIQISKLCIPQKVSSSRQTNGQPNKWNYREAFLPTKE